MSYSPLLLRLIETLRRYHNRSIETAQVIEELIQWAKEMQEDAQLLDKLNLSVDAIFKDPVLSLNIMDSIMIGSVLAESSNSHGVLNFMNNIETRCCCKKQIDDAIS